MPPTSFFKTLNLFMDAPLYYFALSFPINECCVPNEMSAK